MKVFVILLTVFFISPRSYSLEWPDGHYTIKSVSSMLIGQYYNYFNLLKTKYPIIYFTKRNGFIVKDHDETVLEVRLRRLKDKDVLTYRSKSSFVYIIDVFGAKELTNIELLNFELFKVADKDNFNIVFKNFRKEINVTYMDDIKLGRFNFEWGTIYLRETYSDLELTSRFWYKCRTCNGDPLYFFYKKIDNSFSKTYFEGQLLKEVTPKYFYDVANMWYLSGLIREYSSELTSLMTRYGWPSHR